MSEFGSETINDTTSLKSTQNWARLLKCTKKYPKSPKSNQKYPKTLPEAQRTQGIEFKTWIIFFIWNNFSWKVYSSYWLNTLGPLCLWQCLVLLVTFGWFWVLFSSYFGHQVALLELVGCFQLFCNFFSTFLSTFFNFFSTFSWLILNFFSTYSQLFLNFFNFSGGIPCISSYFGHQVAPFEFISNLATKWCHLH